MGLPVLVYFAGIAGLLSLAPHLAVRAGLAAGGPAALAGGTWCGLNFWRCLPRARRRQRHRLAGAELARIHGGRAGHSLIGGYEQPVFLAVLGRRICARTRRQTRGTNAITASTAQLA